MCRVKIGLGSFAEACVPRDDASTRGDGRTASPATVRRSRFLLRRNVSPHLLEGKGSRVNVVPSEAGLGVKFLHMKQKMKANVEEAELTAAMDQLRGRVLGEASVATLFDWLHRMRKMFFVWCGNVVRTVLVEFHRCTRVPRYG